MIRRVILAIGLLGTTLFTLVLVASYVNPILIERAAREVVRIEVERRVGEKIDALSASRLTGLAQKALGKTHEEMESTRRAIAQEMPSKVSLVVANMLNADCECRRRLKQSALRIDEGRLSSLNQVRERLVGFVEAAYATVTASLMRELRIVAGSNAVAFAVLALVAYFRRGAALQLLVPSVILVGAVGITLGFYIFSQDWLHTILYSQYVGWGYAAYLGVVAAFLTDVLVNRARVTTRLINAILLVIGSAMTVAAC